MKEVYIDSNKDDNGYYISIVTHKVYDNFVLHMDHNGVACETYITPMQIWVDEL